VFSRERITMSMAVSLKRVLNAGRVFTGRTLGTGSERLAKRHMNALKASRNGCGNHRPFQPTRVSLQRIEQILRKRLPAIEE